MDPVALVAHGLGQGHALFRVVAGRGDETTGVVGIGVIEVAIDDHLPGYVHAFGIDSVEHSEVVVGVLQVAAVIDLGDRQFGIGEDVLGVRHLLQAQTVNRLDVGDGGDLVRLHDIETNARNAGVSLVVDK